MLRQRLMIVFKPSTLEAPIPPPGGNVAALYLLVVLYKKWDYTNGRWLLYIIKPSVEVVTEPNQHLCKRESRHGGTTHTNSDTDIMPPMHESNLKSHTRRHYASFIWFNLNMKSKYNDGLSLRQYYWISV